MAIPGVTSTPTTLGLLFPSVLGAPASISGLGGGRSYVREDTASHEGYAQSMRSVIEWAGLAMLVVSCALAVY